MNVELLEKAREKVPSVPTLINLISQRMRQLIDKKGDAPHVPWKTSDDKLDIVLREIAEGKLTAEYNMSYMTEDEDGDEE